MHIVNSDKVFRHKGFAQRVIRALVLRGKSLGYDSLYLNEVYEYNIASQKCFVVISVSGDLKIEKPNERIFLLTVEKPGVSAEHCIYVDDRAANVI